MTPSNSESDASGDPAAPLFRRGAWGRLALALLPLVAVSGVVLSFLYRPGDVEAWWSVAAIRGGDWSVVRDVHRWGGELLLIAAWLHVFRVFVVGAYRRLSGWTVSVAGAVFVILWMVTGWLLRADASTVAWVSKMGGLQAVYALHVLVLPLALMGIYLLWRGRRRRSRRTET